MADKANEKNDNGVFPGDSGPIVEMRERNEFTDPDETNPDYDVQELLSQSAIGDLSEVDLERLLRHQRVLP